VNNELLASVASALLLGKVVSLTLLLLGAYLMTFGVGHHFMLSSVGALGDVMHALSILGGGYMLTMAYLHPSCRPPHMQTVLGLISLQTAFSATHVLVHSTAMYSREAQMNLPAWVFATLFSIVSILRWSCFGWLLVMTYDQCCRPFRDEQLYKQQQQQQQQEEDGKKEVVVMVDAHQSAARLAAGSAAAATGAASGAAEAAASASPKLRSRSPKLGSRSPKSGGRSPVLKRRVDEAFFDSDSTGAIGNTPLWLYPIVSVTLALAMTLPFLPFFKDFQGVNWAYRKEQRVRSRFPVDTALWVPYAQVSWQVETYIIVYFSTALLLTSLLVIMLRAERSKPEDEDEDDDDDDEAQQRAARLDADLAPVPGQGPMTEPVTASCLHREGRSQTISSDELREGLRERRPSTGTSTDVDSSGKLPNLDSSRATAGRRVELLTRAVSGESLPPRRPSQPFPTFIQPRGEVTLHVRIQLLGFLLLLRCMCQCTTLLLGREIGSAVVDPSITRWTLLTYMFIFFEDGQGFITFLLFALEPPSPTPAPPRKTTFATASTGPPVPCTDPSLTRSPVTLRTPPIHRVGPSELF
jgi:hypothetical protein